MSLHRRPGSPHWHYEFECGGRRHRGSTGTANRRTAEAFERRARDEARQALKASRDATPGKDVPTLAEAAGKWYVERGCHASRPQEIWRRLERLLEEFGPSTPLDQVRTAEVLAAAGRWRARLSDSSVNRLLTEPLRQIFNHWNAGAEQPIRAPDWKAVRLREPKELVREASEDLEERIFEALSEGYRPVFRFSILSGLRLSEAVSLRWPQIDLRGRELILSGKGDRERRLPLTGEMIALLAAERGHHDERVFTYQPRRMPNGSGRRRETGQNLPTRRVPISVEGVKTEWRRVKARLGIERFRWHDLRHTAGTRLLRRSGNLRLVQMLLGHTTIATTVKYAHATLDDLRSAMEIEAEARVTPKPVPAKTAR